MNQESTRASLLTRLRDPADDAAWQEFDRLYRELIHRACRRAGLQPADAEDIRQVVMMNLARTFPRFSYDRSRGRFRAYLARVLRHAIARHLRRGEDDALGSRHDVESPAEAVAVSVVEREWMLHHYRRAMGTIRGSCDAKSLAVFDALLCGQAIDEAAGIFGMTADAVHKVKQRIRDRLKDLIAAQVREEDGDTGPQ